MDFPLQQIPFINTVYFVIILFIIIIALINLIKAIIIRITNKILLHKYFYYTPKNKLKYLINATIIYQVAIDY